MQDITDSLTNPSSAFTVVGGVSAATLFGIGVPDIIQGGTAIYVVLLIIHKIWAIYKDFRGRKNESRE